MALTDSNYRLHINITYSSTATATSALSAINTTLANAGRAEVATRNNLVVDLLIVALSEADAVSLRNALVPAWSGQTRTGGKSAITRSNDVN